MTRPSRGREFAEKHAAEKAQAARSPHEEALLRLNSQGHGFQYSMARTIQRACGKHGIPLSLRVTEFPVEVRGQPTRLDFVFASESDSLFLIGECKRSDPGYSHWYFVSPTRCHYSRGTPQSPPKFVLEQARFIRTEGLYGSTYGLSRSIGTERPTQTPIYHAAFGINTRPKDGAPRSEENRNRASLDIVEHPCRQLMRGLNGLLDHFARTRSRLITQELVRFIPVVFTTAELWVSGADLSAADINSGNVAPEDFAPRRATWLLYQYVNGPELRYSRSWTTASAAQEARGVTHEQAPNALGLGDDMRAEFVRTIAVVTPAGLEEALPALLTMQP